MATASDVMTDIRIIHEPTVYLVGRQVVDDDELERFLADHGVSWQTDTEVAGEHLVEVAGRTCYMSFVKPRPGGNKAYLGHILEVGHGSVLEHAAWNFVFVGISRACTHELVRHRAGFGYCLAGDTLIYSDHYCNGRREGTKKRRLEKFFEMTQSPHGRSRLKLLRLRCLDEQTNTFTQGKLARVACSGIRPVFRIELEDGKAITCSKDHRFLTPRGWLPIQEIVGGLDVSPEGLAVYGSLDTPIMVNGIAAYKDKAWLHEHYHVLGMEFRHMARMAGVSPHTIRAWIRKHRLQKPLGSWTLGRKPWNKGKRYHAGWKHSPETKALFSRQKQGANNPGWHGGTTPYGVKIRKGVEKLRPQILQRDRYRCRLCGRRGGAAKFLTMHHILPIWARPELALDPTNIAAVCRPCHLTVHGHELEYAERFGADPGVIAEIKRPRGKGRLFVPRARHIRKIVYVGEQMTYDLEMDGPHHNFVANGIITHNSQLSQRYVDESVAEYVEPDIIASDPELHRVWLEAVGQCHRAYVTLAQKLQDKFPEEPDRTLRRKLARQAARSVLPNATETKIFVTANARALRHFIEMRASRHAEVEIRKLAVQVLRIMQREAPNMFGDYTLQPLPDGTFEAVTAHRKV